MRDPFVLENAVRALHWEGTNWDESWNAACRQHNVTLSHIDLVKLEDICKLLSTIQVFYVSFDLSDGLKALRSVESSIQQSGCYTLLG